MPRGKKFTAERMKAKFHEAEVGLAQRKTVPELVRKFGVTEQTYYRSKWEYRGPRTPSLPDLAAQQTSVSPENVVALTSTKISFLLFRKPHDLITVCKG